jgi:sporulation protein YlmC with PRC-barrel domain
MAHYGTLKDSSIRQLDEDIRGTAVYGSNDDKLGKVDDVIFDHSTGDVSYVVIDTGGWLSSRKFLVPGDRLRPSTRHEDAFEISMTKQEVESLPAYNESDLTSESKWRDYEGRYRSKWVANPVMHRAETDRNITPTTYQEVGNLDSERAAAAQGHGAPPAAKMRPSGSVRTPSSSEPDLAAANSSTHRIVPAGANTVEIDNSAAGIGGRWDTFQSRLRERRKEAVAQCRTCAGESWQRDNSDDAGTLRKAV